MISRLSVVECMSTTTNHAAHGGDTFHVGHYMTTEIDVERKDEHHIRAALSEAGISTDGLVYEHETGDFAYNFTDAYGETRYTVID